MLTTLQKQQEQISKFMLNTQKDLKMMEMQLDRQTNTASQRIQDQMNQLKEQINQNLPTQQLIEQVASAI